MEYLMSILPIRFARPCERSLVATRATRLAGGVKTCLRRGPRSFVAPRQSTSGQGAPDVLPRAGTVEVTRSTSPRHRVHTNNRTLVPVYCVPPEVAQASWPSQVVTFAASADRTMSQQSICPALSPCFIQHQRRYALPGIDAATHAKAAPPRHFRTWAADIWRNTHRPARTPRGHKAMA